MNSPPEYTPSPKSTIDTNQKVDNGDRNMGDSHDWRQTWQAPVTMVGLLLLGGGSAYGHHRVYDSLDGESLGDDGGVAGQQQRNISYGNTLAIIAKAALVAAISTAYTQHMWFYFTRSRTTVSAMDSKFTATSSIFSLLDPKFLTTSNCGVLLAILTWYVSLSHCLNCKVAYFARLIPLVTVFTPSSLAIIPNMTSEVDVKMVPTINFSKFRATRPYAVTPSAGKLASLVTAGEKIAPVPAFLPNASYNVQFTGPSLVCQYPNNNTKSMIDQVFEQLAGRNYSQLNAVYMAFSPYAGAMWPFFTNGTSRIDKARGTDNADFTNFIDNCLVRPDWRRCPFTDASLGSGGLGESTDTTDALWMRFGANRSSCSIQKTKYNVTFDSRNPLSSLSGYNFSLHGVFNGSEKGTDSESIDSNGYIMLTQSLLDILTGSIFFQPSWCSFRMAGISQCSRRNYQKHSTNVDRTALASHVLLEINNRWSMISNAAVRELSKNATEGLADPNDGALPKADLAVSPGSGTLGLNEILEQMSRNLTLSIFSQQQNLCVPFNSYIIISFSLTCLATVFTASTRPM